MRINVKKEENLIVPTTATPQSSGYDVTSISEPEIVGTKDGDFWKSIDYIQYRTKLFIAPQTDAYGVNYHTLIFPRSSVSKYNLVLANCIGLVDNDYRGELLLRFKYIWQPEDLYVVKLTVNGTEVQALRGVINPQKIYKVGDKIGQLVAEVSNRIDWYVAADLSQTIRGSGGFGSSTTPPTRVEAPKEAANLAEKWASQVNATRPPSYESLVKEREKANQQ